MNSPSSMLVGTQSRIALQTAQALIKGSRQGRVRVLFDSGSHRSFVTTKATSNCELQNRKKGMVQHKYLWSEKHRFGARCFDWVGLLVGISKGNDHTGKTRRTGRSTH